MGFKIVSRYQRIKIVFILKHYKWCTYILDNHKERWKHKDNNRKYQHKCQSATNPTKEL